MNPQTNASAELPIEAEIFELFKKEIEKLKDTPLNKIISVICSATNIDRADVESENRKHEIVAARQLCCYYAKIITGHSLAYIGKAIGSKDHSTVLHSVRTINNRIETKDPLVMWMLNKIQQELNLN